MDLTELFHPQILVTVGQFQFDQGVAIKVCSATDKPFDWAKIRFAPEFQPNISVIKRDPVKIQIGYDSLTTVFEGTVTQPYNAGPGANEILAKDAMLRLQDVAVNNTFLDTTPHEIITYLLGQAGIIDAKLSPQTYLPKKRVPIQRMDGVAAVQKVLSLWGISDPFYMQDGTFYWGQTPKQSKIYGFDYGVNIIGLTRVDGEWAMETAAAPWIRPTNAIQLNHPQLDGELFTVQKVITETNDAGFLRTVIYF